MVWYGAIGSVTELYLIRQWEEWCTELGSGIRRPTVAED